MTSFRFGDQNELAGSVEKKGRHGSKKVHNAKVTSKTTMPPAVSNTPPGALKQNNADAYRARVKKRYPGWGQTVKGFEGGSQSC